MKKVRSKFVCDSVTAFVGGKQIKMKAVTRDTEENKAFWKYTPSGEITVTITNPELFDHFVPGKEYYVDIEEADTENK